MITLSSSAAAVFLLPVALVCLLAAYSDLSRMKLPNGVVLLMVAVYVVLGPFVLSFDQYLWGFSHGVVMYFIGMFAYAYMGVGAGDGKFAAAMALFMPAVDWIAAVILFAAFLLGAFACHRIARAIPAIRAATPNWTSWTHKKFPVGLALSGTMIAYLGLAAFA